jgi:uncharacterized Zn finger protein (UPF0148 family)
MSEFDKEAERRRLREKYESEEADRETTERMSELLLQGATMTNQHCDACGSPIFRYQGQEFCPTCQAEARKQAHADDAPTGDDTESRSAPATESEPAATSEPRQTDSAHAGARRASTGQQAPVPRQQLTPDVPDDATGHETAADALTAAIATLATRAQQTDDPRRAREFLEAAREAAEALAALQP